MLLVAPTTADGTSKGRGLILARLDMLLWNQIELWRHAARARTITGYPFGPANYPVNAFGPWPGGTSWRQPQLL